MAARILKEFTAMASRPALPSAEEAESLSAQQWEILGMVAEGKIYREIALDLQLSEKTIKYHMRRILDILRLETRAQAIAYYQQQRGEDE
jgi:two-component system NarL family response regulator